MNNYIQCLLQNSLLSALFCYHSILIMHYNHYSIFSLVRQLTMLFYQLVLFSKVVINVANKYGELKHIIFRVNSEHTNSCFHMHYVARINLHISFMFYSKARFHEVCKHLGIVHDGTCSNCFDPFWQCELYTLSYTKKDNTHSLQFQNIKHGFEGQ